MKQIKQAALLLLLLLCPLGFAACSSDDNDDEGGGETFSSLSVNVNELIFSSTEGDMQDFQITTDESWTISGTPDWLNISTTSGNGNATVKLTTSEFNNSATQREGRIIISAGNAADTISVIQRAGFLSTASVTPDNIVCLSNGAAFDYTFGSDVSFYYVTFLKASDAGRYTDSEIVENLKEEDQRDTPEDGYITTLSGLQPETQYIVYSVGFDRNGKQGELVKTNITTKSNSNQPRATVEIKGSTNTLWHWDTAIGPYCKQYYMWAMGGSATEMYDTFNMNDAALAWYFNRNMKNYPDDFTPIIQNGSWTMQRSSSDYFLQVITWGTDGDGNFSGIITNVEYSPLTDTTSKKGTKAKVRKPAGNTPAISTFKKSNFPKPENIVRIK